MSNNKSTISNIIGVLISNVTTIVAGIIIGFIIPKVLTIEGYGYYKTFTLYATYVGLFSMGIIDGIVLDYGGCDYEYYDRGLFRSIIRWYGLIHLLWTIILLGVSIFFHESNYSFIIIMIAVYMIFSNFVGYFQQISQITQRFDEYSRIKIIQSAMRMVSGLIMIGLFFLLDNNVDYRIYISLTVFEFIIVAISYYKIYRDIIIGPYDKLKQTKNTVIHLSTIGFPLLFANLSSTIILNMDRQFVNVLFSNSEYAVYAFAYNMLSLVTVATSAVATVLYPILKRTTKDALRNNYSSLIGAMLVFVFGTLIVFFPLSCFIKWFLPGYTDSLIIFRIVFPGLAISSAVTVIMHNYYKTLGDNNKFFIRSLIILAVSIVANFIAYGTFHTTVSISIASIITMLIWYFVAEQYFVINYEYNRRRNLSYLILMMGVFYAVTCVKDLVISGIMYLSAFAVITLLLQKEALVAIKSLKK